MSWSDLAKEFALASLAIFVGVYAAIVVAVWTVAK